MDAPVVISTAFGSTDHRLPLGTIDDEGGSGFGALSFDRPDLMNGGSDGDGVALVDPADNVLEFISWEGVFVAGEQRYINHNMRLWWGGHSA